MGFATVLQANFYKISEFPVKRLQDTYSFWKEHWQKEFQEQNLADIDTSCADDFVTSDEVLVVNNEDLICGIVLLNNFDRRLEPYRDHSYFQGFPLLPEKKITALRYYISHPSVRHGRGGMQISRLLLALCFERFYYSEQELLVGMPLKAKGAHNLTYKFGMKSLTNGEPHFKHNVEVDYVSLEKEDLNLKLISELKKKHFEAEEGEQELYRRPA